MTRINLGVHCARCGHGGPRWHVPQGPLAGVCGACRAVGQGPCLHPIREGPQRSLADYA